MIRAHDINLLVYAYSTGARNHRFVRLWGEGLRQRKEPIGLPWRVHLKVRGSCFCLWAESPVAQSAGLQPCVKPIGAERGLKGRPRSHSSRTYRCS
jgi:hypothetical protein